MTPSSCLRLSFFASLFLLSATYAVDYEADRHELAAAVDSSSTVASTVAESTVTMGVGQTTESIEVTTDSGCHDNPDTNCASMKNYCNVTAYQNTLRQNCPVTCGLCHDCYDTSSNCEAWSKQGLCTKSYYKDSMAKDCAKTCHFCSPDSCIDESDYCADWLASGICTKTSFKKEAEALCRKTCGFCT